MQNISHDDLIKKYLDGSLTESEQMIFDKAMSDKTFQKSLLFQAQLLDEFKSQQTKAILGQIKQQAGSTKPNVQSLNPNKRYSFALKLAAALLILLTAIYFLNPLGTVNYEEQFEQYMIDYPVHLIERGSSNENELSDLENQKALKEALKAYSNNDYKTAASKFELLNDSDERLLLNQASAYLRITETDKAINILRPLCGSTTDKIADNANWYLALAYVQKNDIQRAIDLLNVITQNEGSLWWSQAKSLLTELM